MKKDNKGWSLIEIIVVLAILGIAAGFGISGLSYIFGTEVKSCANEIYSSIGETKINTMGRYETVIHIYEDTNGFFEQEWHLEGGSWINSTPQRVGRTFLTLQYTLNDGTTGTIDNDGIWISFNRAGGQEQIAPSLPPASTGITGIFTNITVSGAVNRTVTIVPATGKLQVTG